jgi:hypothetical protein
MHQSVSLVRGDVEALSNICQSQESRNHCPIVARSSLAQ